MKAGSEVEYYFFTKIFCKFCKQEFSKKTSRKELREHIKKYHDDEMDFEDHIMAHKSGKCKCGGVELTR